MKIEIALHKDTNGYWAEVPALDGCFSQGETLDELKINIKEAINAWFLYNKKTDGEVITIEL